MSHLEESLLMTAFVVRKMTLGVYVLMAGFLHCYVSYLVSKIKRTKKELAS